MDRTRNAGSDNQNTIAHERPFYWAVSGPEWLTGLVVCDGQFLTVAGCDEHSLIQSMTTDSYRLQFRARNGFDRGDGNMMAGAGCLVGQIKTPRRKMTNTDNVMAMSVAEADAVLARFGYVDAELALSN